MAPQCTAAEAIAAARGALHNVDIAKAWDDWINAKKSSAPGFLQNYYFANSGIFWYFQVQKTLNSECISGMGTSLLFAFIVLLFATRNIVMAIVSTISIGSIVVSVMFFAVICGWKLGMIEAIVLIMVIGLSVDYVVHLSDAYLECHGHTDRNNRTKFMLRSMGASVLSGAITSIGASICMCFCSIIFFFKFGAVMLWTLVQSVITALVFFTAIMFLFGPEGDFGSLMLIPRYFGYCKSEENEVGPIKNEDHLEGEAPVPKPKPVPPQVQEPANKVEPIVEAPQPKVELQKRPSQWL